MKPEEINVVLDEVDPQNPIFVEIETLQGKSISIGEREKVETYTNLRISWKDLLLTKPVWVAWTNTDLTSGMGWRQPVAVCKLKSTARRLGKGKNVQGCDCNITEEYAIVVGSECYIPGRICEPTTEDEKEQAETNIADKAIEKAKSLGLTDEEISAIQK